MAQKVYKVGYQKFCSNVLQPIISTIRRCWCWKHHFLKRYFTLIYVGECGGVITTDNNEDAPVDQMYQK